MYFTESESVSKIINFFENNNNEYTYENQIKNVVTCGRNSNGVTVSCLGNGRYDNLLPWGVFWLSVNIMLANEGEAARGNAMNNRLGSPGLSFSSIEGHVANIMYGKVEGDIVFRRISPIAHILIGSGICVDKNGDMELIRR